VLAIAVHVQIELSAIEETRWYEYAVRFAFGGLITAIAGIIAKAFGPVVGGLFLAFPAIFPASATLVEKHEREKARAGHKRDPELAGRKSVAIDAAGAALGSVALFAFAFTVRQLEVRHATSLVLLGATLVWTSLSLLLWWVGDRLHTTSVAEGQEKTETNEDPHLRQRSSTGYS
jgi:hypothetical protein